MKTLANIIGYGLGFTFACWIVFGTGAQTLMPFIALFVVVGLTLAVLRVAAWGLFGSK
jgi:hypothetical protein